MSLETRALKATLQLPSRGVRYGGKIPGGTVRIGCLTVEDEQVFDAVTPRPESKIEHVFRECVDYGAPFDPLDLLVDDRMFLLIQVRAITYGSNYTFDHQCPACLVPHRPQVDLSALPIRVLEETDTEPFEVFLPVAGVKVSLRSLRGRDEQLIHRTAAAESSRARAVQSTNRDPSRKYRLAAAIVAINGDTKVTPATKLDFVSKLNSIDTLAIDAAIEEKSCGYALEIDIECPNCHALEQRTQLPRTEEFLRPRTLDPVHVQRVAEAAASARRAGVQQGGRAEDAAGGEEPHPQPFAGGGGTGGEEGGGAQGMKPPRKIHPGAMKATPRV